MPRHRTLVLALILPLLTGIATLPQRAESLLEQAFAEYTSGDHQAIARIVPERHFQGSGVRTLRKELDAAISRWERDRRPMQAVFQLEVAHFGLVELREPGAVEVLQIAREFVADRNDPPGRNPQQDAFEIAWHKTAVALLAGMRRPDVLDDVGVARLRQRMSAALDPRDEPRLVGPWIELARALVEEQRTTADPRTLHQRVPLLFSASMRPRSTKRTGPTGADGTAAGGSCAADDSCRSAFDSVAVLRTPDCRDRGQSRDNQAFDGSAT